MSNSNKTQDQTLGSFNPKVLHPVLMQAMYVVPRCILRDAWWLVDPKNAVPSQPPFLQIISQNKGHANE